MFISKTPNNIDELSVQDIVKLAKTTGDIMPPVVRCRIVQMLFDILGLDLSNDVLLMLISEPKAKLCLATAGGGKTSSANVQILAEKIMRKSISNPDMKIRGSKILCLVYNKHNVSDFYEKHKKMVNRLRCANIKGLDIDDEFRVYTMHSYCEMWRKEYAVECDLVNFTLVQEDQALAFMQNALNVAMQKYHIKNDGAVNVSNLYTLYTFQKESKYSDEELEGNDKFLDLKLPIEVVSTVFRLYESTKKRRRVYDFTDMLTKIYQLLTTHPAILKRVQSFHEYVVVDEVQDFTPLMVDILKLFVGPKTPLMCIGDEDQSVYGFRGADIYNTLDFGSKFDGGEVYVLSRNRRCRREILETAKRVIQKNSMRYQKSINVVKEGGSVEYVPYLTTEGQMLNVIGRIKDYNMEQLQETVIAFREKEGSRLLTQLLAENRIPHYVISGYTAYSHELYRHMLDVLTLLWRPFDRYAQLNLYKILPVDRKALYDILQYDPQSNSFPDTVNSKHFAQIDYGRFMSHNNFKEVIAGLAKIAQSIDTAPMNAYIPLLFSLMKKYFWNLKKQYNARIEIDDIFEKKVFEYFNCACTFEEFQREHDRLRSVCKVNQNSRRGVAISTFHGLKGLEFNTVFLINLDNDIFPNYPLIDSRNYTPQLKQSLKEAEVRLFYVAITRARNNVFMYYQQNNPSLFVRELLGDSYHENKILYDTEHDDDADADAENTNNGDNIEGISDEDSLFLSLLDDSGEESEKQLETNGPCIADHRDDVSRLNNLEMSMHFRNTEIEKSLGMAGDNLTDIQDSGVTASDKFIKDVLSCF